MNDHAPRFPHLYYVFLAQPTDTFLTKLEDMAATDQDLGDVLSYDFGSGKFGDPSDFFQVSLFYAFYHYRKHVFPTQSQLFYIYFSAALPHRNWYMSSSVFCLILFNLWGLFIHVSSVPKYSK